MTLKPKKISSSIRVIRAFHKKVDEDGHQSLAKTYSLKPLKLLFLQKLLDIDPNDPDPIIRNVILCYDIDEKRAAALQPYMIDGTIDLEKYDYMLVCYADKN